MNGKSQNGKTKSFEISKRLVWEAYKRVKANRGAAGVDWQSLENFEQNLKGNLYKIWNRMTSGSYFPPAVRVVEIPKSDGGKRPLGIPTVADRIAQMVVKLHLEPTIEPYFHPDSYGYRPNKSALDAVGKARERCFNHAWAIDLDIKGFFDNLNHDLVMKAVERHTKEPWILLYIKRWLKAPAQYEDGTIENREKGTPQGGVVSPLIANVFMHYAFDKWLSIHYPTVQFERYADDAILHLSSLKGAKRILSEVSQRMKDCGLELHPQKTKIVYCKNVWRKGQWKHHEFDFLGYTFRPRRCRSKHGQYYHGFLPAISQKAMKSIRQKVRDWKLSSRLPASLTDIAKIINPPLRGWINYYGKFYRSEMYKIYRYVELKLSIWAKKKYKPIRTRKQAFQWLKKIAKRDPFLICIWKHWQLRAVEQ